MKRYFLTLMLTAATMMAMAEEPEMHKYEIERDMPLFLDSIKSELTYPLAWGNSDITDFDTWRSAARDKVVELMLAPPPRAKDYDIRIVDEERRDGYTARKIEFNLTRYSRVTAYVLVPDGEGPFPGIVALHDHGGHYTIGKEKMIRPFGVGQEVYDDSDKWVEGLYEGQYVGDYLARNGYVVISTDALFWGDRGRKEGPDGKKFANVAGNFMMLGRNMSAWMTFEDMYATEFLASLPEVDADRIGCIGLSMGAYRSWMLAALSPIIRAGVAVCWMTTTDVQLSWEYGRESGGFANNLIGVRNYLDYPHIASLACPESMYFVNGETDKLFQPHSVLDAYATMHAVWDSQGVGDRLRTELLPMGHEMPLSVQKSSLDFLNNALGNSNH
ncbi:MAG: dienelactone hydrolase family protein [Muribaculaceae bacterium]|nr:dienelactone hydrolase family protein [Muribaculaceae bacterium]